PPRAGGRPQRALEDYHRARALLEAPTREDPGPPRHRRQPAMALAHPANLRAAARPVGGAPAGLRPAAARGPPTLRARPRPGRAPAATGPPPTRPPPRCTRRSAGRTRRWRPTPRRVRSSNPWPPPTPPSPSTGATCPGSTTPLVTPTTAPADFPKPGPRTRRL